MYKNLKKLTAVFYTKKMGAKKKRGANSSRLAKLKQQELLIK